MEIVRDISQLAHPFKGFVMKFLDECEANDLHIFITESYRTQERQNYLYSLGRTRKGTICTWTLYSKHTERQAIDIAFKGHDLYPDDSSLWDKVYDIAERHYIKSLYRLYGKDRPHLEFGGTVPYNEDDIEFSNYITMDLTPEQKELIQAMIYQFKNCFNYGTEEMKDVVSKQVKEWKDLLNK